MAGTAAGDAAAWLARLSPAQRQTLRRLLPQTAGQRHAVTAALAARRQLPTTRGGQARQGRRRQGRAYYQQLLDVVTGCSAVAWAELCQLLQRTPA